MSVITRGGRIRPRTAILWNGVTLEELGIADLLKSADLTLSIGRTNPSSRHPTGKPKVGGASVTFLMPNEAAGLRLHELLLRDERPMLTMGFGYHGQQSYWLGEAAIRTKPDMKQFGQVRGYKIESVQWNYGAELPFMTMNGMAGRVMALTEHRRPTVWNNKTLAQISEGIANEHGLVLRISGAIPASQRIAHAMQFSGESRLSALNRIIEGHGGTLQVSTISAVELPGASRGYKYFFDGGSAAPTADDQLTVRTILTIKAIHEEFVDLSGLEQTRPIVIGYAPLLSPTKFASGGGGGGVGYALAPDFVARKVVATDDGMARGVPTAAGVSKSGDTVVGSVKKALATAAGEISVTGILAEGGIALAETLFAASDKPKEGVGVPFSATHEDLGGATLDVAKAQSVAVAHGIKTRISIELFPGAPELACGTEVEVRGTYTHDGFYGVEESRNVNDVGGLTTTLTARPILKGGSESKNSKQQDKAATLKAKSADRSASGELTVTGILADQGIALADTLFEISKVVAPRDPEAGAAPEPVDAAPPGGEAALEQQIESAP